MPYCCINKTKLFDRRQKFGVFYPSFLCNLFSPIAVKLLFLHQWDFTDQVKYNKTFYMLLFSTKTGWEIRKKIWLFSWGEILINLLFSQNGRKQSRRSWFSFSFINFNTFIDDLRKKHLVEFKSTKHRHRSLAVLILRPFFRIYWSLLIIIFSTGAESLFIIPRNIISLLHFPNFY